MANTTWNPSDKAAGITLSGGNLIATANTSAAQCVRAIDRQLTGKFYWEYTCNAFTNAGNGVGVAGAFAALTSSMVTLLPGCGVRQSGVVFVDTTNPGVSLGTITAGTVVCVAVDAGARLIWFRYGAAGNWNANASYNPATGVGGVSINSLGAGIPLYPWISVNTLNDQVTANFGDTAFTGAVPSGFTSGFPAYTGTVLLCHADGANGSTTFNDTSGRGHTLTAVSATVTTAQAKFGTGASNHSAMASSAVQVTGTLSDFDFQGGPFTIECWAWLTSVPGVSSLFSQFNNSTGGGFFFGSVAGTLAFWHYNGAGTQVQYNTGVAMPTTGAWHHYCADRDAGGTLRLYIDGVVAGSTSAPTFQSATPQANIGNSNRNVDVWPGYIDEVRVTKGVARYGGAFTPPTAPFADGVSATNALASQVAAEHWLTTNPDAQVTQAFVEHWSSVASDNLQAIATQVLIEHWSSVAVVVPASGGPMVTMIH